MTNWKFKTIYKIRQKHMILKEIFLIVVQQISHCKDVVSYTEALTSSSERCQKRREIWTKGTVVYQT